MLRPQKDNSVAELTAALRDAAGVIFVDYTGLTVAESDGFRRSLRGTDVRFRVVKNTLMARALTECGHNSDVGEAAAALRGTPTGFLWGTDDPVAVAKAAVDYGQQCEHLKLKGGVVEQRLLSAPEALALSKMPSRGQLQAGIAALARGPERALLGSIAAGGSRIAGAIAALVERLGGGGGSGSGSDGEEHKSESSAA